MPARVKRPRTPHYWTPNHGSSVPREFCFVQVKTMEVPNPNIKDSSIARLDLGVADMLRWDDGRVKRWQRWTFANPVDFWSAFHQRIRGRTSPWIVGHGIARTFTLLDGWNLLDDRTYSLQPNRFDSKSQSKQDSKAFENEAGWLVDNDPPTVLLLHGHKVILHVVDIQNYGQASLEDIGEAAGIAIPEAPHQEAGMDAWEKWLTLRVVAVREYFLGLIDWWQTNDCGRWRHTMGGLAMSAYRHKFLTKNIFVHNNAPVLKLEREALAGGEFRAFYVGKVTSYFYAESHARPKSRGAQKWLRHGPIYTFDCNSLYPAMMRDRDMPKEFQCALEQGSVADLLAWRKRFLLCAQVCVETVDTSYPLWFDNERYWAVGKFWTTLCGPELHNALDAGQIKGVGMVSAYWPSALFPEFVDYFHGLRRKAPHSKAKLWDRFCKSILVSLAGKCAQRTPLWEFDQIQGLYPDYGTFTRLMADGEVKEYRAIAGSTMVKTMREEGIDSVPIISAFINSYARAYMREVRLAVGAANVLYMGSDSLHVTEPGLPGLQPYLETMPGELGKFRSTGVFETAEYRGPSDYTVGERHVIAGMKAGSGQVLHGEYCQSNEPSLQAILTHKPDGRLVIKRIKKSISGWHPKGIINPDGTVSPPQMIDGTLQFNRKHPKAYPWIPPVDKRK